MNSFMTYGLHQAYDRFAKLGDPLAEVNSLIDWERFRSTAEMLYDNKTGERGPSQHRLCSNDQDSGIAAMVQSIRSKNGT